MSYMLLIMETREQRPSRTPEEGRAVYARMVRWGEDLTARGLLKGSESLTSDAHAVRVEKRSGKKLLLDGPFSEAKEFVGGFFLIDCESREQAVAIALECPAVEWATVEVREVAPCFET